MWWLFTFADDTRVCSPNAFKQQVASFWTLKTCLIIIFSVNILNVSHHLILEQGRLLIGRLIVAIVDIWAENKTQSNQTDPHILTSFQGGRCAFVFLFTSELWVLGLIWLQLDGSSKNNHGGFEKRDVCLCRSALAEHFCRRQGI